MSIQQRMADLQAKDQALLDALDPDTQAAITRRLKSTAMAAGMHEVLGTCKSFGEAQTKADHYVYEDAVQPKPKPEALAA